MEDEGRQNDSMTWKDLVNELRMNLEEKSRREGILNSKLGEKMAKLEQFLKEEKLKGKKLEEKDSEIAQLKIKIRKMRTYTGEDNKRPPSPMILKSSNRNLRGSYKRPQTPKLGKLSNSRNSIMVDRMIDDHHSSFSQLKNKLLDLKSKMGQ